MNLVPEIPWVLTSQRCLLLKQDSWERIFCSKENADYITSYDTLVYRMPYATWNRQSFLIYPQDSCLPSCFQEWQTGNDTAAHVSSLPATTCQLTAADVTHQVYQVFLSHLKCFHLCRFSGNFSSFQNLSCKVHDTLTVCYQWIATGLRIYSKFQDVKNVLVCLCSYSEKKSFFIMSFSYLRNFCCKLIPINY